MTECSGNPRHTSGDEMRCYSEREGSKFQLCQKKLGYRTCFVQYNKGIYLTYTDWDMITVFSVAEGGIARRGCSTKMPMFHVECENHVSGVKSEKFCYCSYQLCNNQERIEVNSVLIPLIIILSTLVIAELSWRLHI